MRVGIINYRNMFIELVWSCAVYHISFTCLASVYDTCPEDHKPYQGTLGTLEVILIWSRTRLGPSMDPTGTLSWTLFLSIFHYAECRQENSLFRNPELCRKKSARDAELPKVCQIDKAH